MKRFTSNDEIENLCEAMIKDFFKSKHYTNVMCVDIEAFVREYLGVPIVYETFAEPHLQNLIRGESGFCQMVNDL